MKKNIFTLVLLCLLPLAGLQAQTPYYYYYKGEKQYLEVSPDKVLVQFTENTDTTTVRTTIGESTSLSVSGISKTNHAGGYLVRFTGTDTAETKNLIRQWKNRDTILYSGPVFVNETGKEIAALTNQLIVRLKRESDYPVLQNSIRMYSIDTVRQAEFNSKTYLISLHYASGKNAMEVANELHETGLFEFAEPDLLLFIEYQGEFIPNDTYFPYQWNLKNTGQYGGIPGIDIKATYAWGITTGDSNIIIGIYDDRIDPTHPDLIDNIVPDSGSGGGESHGTVCAGICAARGNNARGITGVTHHCRILHIDGMPSDLPSNMATKIHQAVQDGARVISMSFSTSSVSNVLEQAFSDAFDFGCVLVAGSGNGGGTGILYPAAYDKVIAVGAINPWGERKSFTSCDTETKWGSNYGRHLDVMAPGVLIPATDVQEDRGYNPNRSAHIKINGGSLLSEKDEYTDRDYTRWFAGTSAACPHVAGVAALMLSANPNLSAQQVWNIIDSTAQKVRPDLYNYHNEPGRDNGLWDSSMGYGVVNAYAAVLKAIGCEDPANLVVRDSPDDAGTEPGLTPDSLLWDSPDIWVRHFDDRSLTHQQPCPGDTNYIHIRVRNYGCLPSTGDEKVTLYWAKTDTAMAWPDHWQGNTYPGGQLRGDSIGTFTVNYGMQLTAGEEYTVVVPWQFPDPGDYAAINSEPGLFTLLARIEANNDTLTYPETSSVMDNARNNNKIALKNISLSTKMDLMVKDASTDRGDEPNADFYFSTREKPDIWVRHQPDNGLVHQNPVSDTVNYVYVRITNTGCEPSTGHDSLELYWAKASTGLSWPSSWQGNNLDSTSLLSGDLVGTYPISAGLTKGEEHIMEIPWHAPEPIDYYGLIDEPWNFFLLARIESGRDTMTFPETSSVESNVVNNNNIAWKRVDVAGTIDLLIRNTENDMGIVPDTSAIVWNSPDIWVRHYGDSIIIPQDPRPDTVNYVYVRIQNTGNAFSRGNDQLELYWAKGKSNIVWPSGWTKICVYIIDTTWNGIGVPRIDDSIVSYTIPNILPGGDAIIEIPWKAPDPNDYYHTHSDPRSFSLLARIISDKDTLTYPLTTHTDSNVRNNNNIACKNIDIGKVDVMIRDHGNDAGIEPDSYNGAWDSPDIWVRHTQDDSSNHQNPVPNNTNYVYLRIKNIGKVPSQGNEILKLYWAKSGTGLAWDSCWSGNYFSQGPLMGNYIDSVVLPVMQSQDDTIVWLPWEVPDPAAYYGINNNPYLFHLLARIESQLDTMSYPETTDIDSNVGNNNNIALRGVNIERVDLMTKRFSNDTGSEPVSDSSIILDSPDIWVRHNDDNIQIPQEPDPSSYQYNYVYVRVKNGGGIPSKGNEKLHLNWAKGDSLTWPCHWNGSIPFLGDSIGTRDIPIIQPGEDTIVKFEWELPMPSDYFNTFEDPSLFYLLTRIEAPGSDPLVAGETADIHANVRNNNNIAMKRVKNGRMDLSIKRTPDDTGSDTLSTGYTLWDSPDIWVRRQRDGYTNFQHQTPKYDPANQVNYIYVRIRNTGHVAYNRDEYDNLELYWVNTGTGLRWPDVWNQPIPGEYESMIAMQIPNIGPDEETIVEIEWIVPNPANTYYTNYTHPWDFCLLARIMTNDDPITNETSDVVNNASYNNNIALKRINIVNEVDLMIKDNLADTGVEPNETTDIFYESPDIWIRNNPDDSISHQNPTGNYMNYVYVRVKNKSNTTSTGIEKLYLHWSKGGTNLTWPRCWDGTWRFSNPSRAIVGNLIDSVPIPRLAPGQSTIIKFPWFVPSPYNYNDISPDMEGERFHFCLLARIVAPDSDPMAVVEITDLNQNVKYNNNIAQKNVTIIKVIKSGSVGAIISVGNGYDWAHPFCLQFKVADDVSAQLLQDAEITAILDSTLYQRWQTEGKIKENIEVKEGQTFVVKAANASLCNIKLDPGEFGLLDMHFNFPVESSTIEQNYTFHVIQTDYETGNIIGGEVYSIIKSAGTRFQADAGEDVYADEGETVTLSAVEVDEPASYNWYKQDGGFIHEGMELVVDVTQTEKYTLEVIASADDYKSYAEVWVRLKPSRIETIFPNPATDEINVTYKLNNVENAYISLSHLHYPDMHYVYDVDVTSQSRVFDIHSYPIGVYVITLVCDGEPVSSHTFIKH